MPRISVDVPLLKAVENFPVVNLMVLNLCNHCAGRRLKTLLHSLVFLLLFTIMPSTDVKGWVDSAALSGACKMLSSSILNYSDSFRNLSEDSQCDQQNRNLGINLHN